MSKTNGPVTPLLLLLEEERKEFNRITNKFHRSNDFALANEEIDLWEDRTCEDLTALGARDAVIRLRNAKWTIIAGKLQENMEQRIEAKDTVLVSLLNDISNHPQFCLKRIKKTSLPEANPNGRTANNHSPKPG